MQLHTQATLLVYVHVCVYMCLFITTSPMNIWNDLFTCKNIALGLVKHSLQCRRWWVHLCGITHWVKWLRACIMHYATAFNTSAFPWQTTTSERRRRAWWHGGVNPINLMHETNNKMLLFCANWISNDYLFAGICPAARLQRCSPTCKAFKQVHRIHMAAVCRHPSSSSPCQSQYRSLGQAA